MRFNTPEQKFGNVRVNMAYDPEERACWVFVKIATDDIRSGGGGTLESSLGSTRALVKDLEASKAWVDKQLKTDKFKGFKRH